MKEENNIKIAFQSFTSFEDINEADAKVMANISPVTHLQNAVSVIKKVYAEQLKTPMNKILKLK